MAQLARATVLVVEHEPMLRVMLSVFLADRGFRVVTARSAEEAQVRAQEAHPDVLALDLEIPDADAGGVLGHLRRSTALAEVPVVAIVPHSFRHDAARFAAAILRRPFGAPEVDRALDQALAEGAPRHT